MPHLRCVGVNDAFRMLVEEFAKDPLGFDNDIVKGKNSSRVGNVIQALEPVIVTYLHPTHRVLFNQARDANPFLHLFESLHMLQGRSDVAPLNYYSSKFSTFCSDDGVTQHAAYGRRWRNWFGYDQLEELVKELKENSSSRRCVLTMWDACCCEECKPSDYTYGKARHDLFMATHGGKDTPCNTHSYFLINNGRLDMTVCNRSNDLILGMLGANVVHFSFLLEYMAAHIGVEVGVYNQVTNNLHVYENNFKSEEWLVDTTPNYYTRVPRINGVKLVKDPTQFDKELKVFNECVLGLDTVVSTSYLEPFFQYVALPMALAFRAYKHKEFKDANRYCSEILADDWRIACTYWIRKREVNYNRAKDDGVSYNENPYLVNHLRREA